MTPIRQYYAQHRPKCRPEDVETWGDTRGYNSAGCTVCGEYVTWYRDQPDYWQNRASDADMWNWETGDPPCLIDGWVSDGELAT